MQRPCETERGCKIPPLSRAGRRAVDIRDKLVRLHALNIGGKVLDLCRATLDDLELIAVIEDTLKTDDGGNQDGQDDQD
jgi:hypothetical protein